MKHMFLALALISSPAIAAPAHGVVGDPIGAIIATHSAYAKPPVNTQQIRKIAEAAMRAAQDCLVAPKKNNG